MRTRKGRWGVGGGGRGQVGERVRWRPRARRRGGGVSRERKGSLNWTFTDNPRLTNLPFSACPTPLPDFFLGSGLFLQAIKSSFRIQHNTAEKCYRLCFTASGHKSIRCLGPSHMHNVLEGLFSSFISIVATGSCRQGITESGVGVDLHCHTTNLRFVVCHSHKF